MQLENIKINSANRKLIYAIASNYVGKYSRYILSFLFSIYFVRKLSQANYGTWNLYLITFHLLIGLSALGFPSLIQRYIPEFMSRSDHRNTKKIVIISFMTRILLLFLFFIVLYVGRQYFASVFKIPNFSNILLIIGLICLIKCINSNYISILNALIKHNYRNIIELIGYVLQIILFIYVLENGGEINELLWAFLISCVFQTVFFAIVLIRQDFMSSNDVEKNLPLKELSHYGFFGMLREFGDIAFSNISDLYIIGIYLNPVSVAIYALATKVTKMATGLIPVNIGKNAILPAFFKKYDKTNDTAYLLKGFNFFNKTAAFLVFPMVAYFLVFSDKIVTYIYGVQYADSANILRILFVFHALNSFGLSIGLVLLSLKHIEISFYSRIFIIYNIIMAIILIKIIGLIGVAFATGTAILFKYMFIFFYLRKYIDLRYDIRSFLRPILNSCILSIVMLLMNVLVQSMSSLVLLSIFCSVLYLFISYKNKVFSLDEANILNSGIGKRLVVF